MGEVLPPKPSWFDPPPPKTKRADLLVNPFIILGGAEEDRTPDPKTAGREKQKIIILDISPGFPFKMMNQGLDCFMMVLSVTMIMPVRIIFSTILAQLITSYRPSHEH
jgi:hypothetical protein